MICHGSALALSPVASQHAVYAVIHAETWSKQRNILFRQADVDVSSTGESARYLCSLYVCLYKSWVQQTSRHYVFVPRLSSNEARDILLLQKMALYFVKFCSHCKAYACWDAALLCSTSRCRGSQCI